MQGFITLSSSTHFARLNLVSFPDPLAQEEKRSGVPYLISWASARVAKPLKNGKDTRIEMNKFYYCKGSATQ